jgi:hypothetical protein
MCYGTKHGVNPILDRTRWRRSLQVVRTGRLADAGSNHSLLAGN